MKYFAAYYKKNLKKPDCICKVYPNGAGEVIWSTDMSGVPYNVSAATLLAWKENLPTKSYVVKPISKKDVFFYLL